MVQLDDYFRPAEQVPIEEGQQNWDHPDALFLDKLGADLKELKSGRSVLINTKNLRLNPQYAVTEMRIPVRFVPRPVILVEGFLVLWDPAIRALLDDSFYLEAPHAMRYARRVHFKDARYEEQVLQRMQGLYLEPTKQYARHVVNVGEKTADDVFEYVERELADYLS